MNCQMIVELIQISNSSLVLGLLLQFHIMDGGISRRPLQFGAFFDFFLKVCQTNNWAVY